jgi:antirestriction protein ArdC/DNA polymerase III epsilon subunit-like protein
MSKKNQRQLHILSQSATTYSTRQQARLIRNEALQMIEAANEFTTNTRRVNRRSAFRVISRSLHSSEGLPFSVRKHQALTELSNYIALAKHNKVVGLTAFNTDLLPLTHPRSTREHSMTASAIIRTHVQWVTDDPRITDEKAKALIASAMLAPANSPEKLYAITRLENLPQGHVPLDAMTAAYGGGNSAAAKRARVALQLRDRMGRWVEMFGGLGIKVKRRDGSTASLSGRAVGQNIFSPQLADVELGDGRIVAMPIRQARGSNFLASDEAKKDGFTRSGSTADDMGDPIIDEADLTFMESPSSFDKDERGSKQGTTKYTDQAYDVVKFDDNKRALADLTETNKRRAELDLDDAAVDKQGETDADTGKQFWDPEKPIYAVSRRGATPFAYTQNWNDAQQRIQSDQRFLDEEEGRTPLAKIAQDDNTPEDETPLVDQQDKFKKEEIARLPEPETTEAPAGFEYKVPEDTYEVTNPTAPYRSVSEYDDPASLANMFQGDELIEGLDDSLDTGLGRLTFPDSVGPDGEPTGGEQEVPAEAILKAIDEKGGDAELALAQAYDKRLGTNENEDALAAQRELDKEGKIGEPKKLGEVFDEVTKAPEPEAEAPVEETPVADVPEITEDVEPSTYPALIDGLTEEEQAEFDKNKDYTPYLTEDAPVEWPEGSTPPQNRILSEEERAQALEIANSDIPDEDLVESYNGAIKNKFDEDGYAPFGDLDENNEVQTIQVPSEVLRDAMKLRNFDMDETNQQVLDGTWDEVDPEDEVALEEEPVAEIPTPKAPAEGKGSKIGKDPLKEGWTVDDWLSDLSKDQRFQEMIRKNKDFTRLAGFYDDYRFDSPLSADYVDKDMEGFESGSEIQAIDLGEYGFEAGPAARVKYALDLLEDPTMSARAGFKDRRTGERSAENERNILKAADEQLDLAKQDLSEKDVIENKAIDSVRETLAKEIAKLDKQVEKDKKAEEEAKIAPQVSYKLRGDRLELRSGKKAPFRIQEVKDFLDDNGFDWNPDAKAETKSGMDEKQAKAFLKELKDRFGIDLLEREGQARLDLDAIDETPEAPEEAAPETTDVAGPEISKDKTQIADALPDTLPEGWTKDPESATLAKNEDGTILDLVDEPGAKYWFLLGGSLEQSVEFNSPQEAFDYHEKNMKGETAPEVSEEAPVVEEQPVEVPEDVQPETAPSREPIPEETVVQEAILDAITEDGPTPTISELIDKLKRKIKGDDEVVGEFGTRGDMISKLMWAKWGAGFWRNESPYIRRSMSEYKSKLKKLSDEELIAMVNDYYDEIDARLEAERESSRPSAPTILSPEEVAEQERKRKVKELRDKKRREREDKLIAEDEKAEPSEPVEEPAVAVTPRIAASRTTDLKPGDVMTKDFFTVTKVEPGLTKKRGGEEVPASQVSGYYPGGVEQSSKLWADDVLFDVYRDVTPPAKGDLPELNQPKMGDYGKLTKVNDEWEIKDPAAQKQFEQDMEKYQEQLSSQKALWNAPEVEAPVKEFTPENTLHVVNALGKDLKPNDIAFRRDENGELSEFFVIEEVLDGTVMVERADGKPAEEKVQIRGYYPGHESQVKSWKTGTSVEVLRGEQAANIPAKGDKPAIDSIEPGTLKGQAYKDKNAEISALRKEAGKAYTPDLTASDIPAVLVEKPNSFNRGNRPAFFGKAAELANLKDGKAISDALKGKRVVYFDFETVGTGKFDNDNPDAPIQVAASVWEGGEKVGEINLFINPNEPLGDFYYKIDEDGNKVIDPEKLLSSDGQTVDDAFLASQPSIEDQLRAFAEFAGQDAIFVAHNAEFDTNTFEQWAKKLGIDYKIDGVIDTLELAKSMTPKGNKLGQVAKRYGIEKTDEEWHDARTDSEVLPAILEGLLGDMKPDNREFDAATRLAEFEAKRSSYNEKLEAFKKQEAELAMAEAVKRGMAGEPVSVDEMLGKTKTTSGFGPEGSTDSAEEYAYESIFGGKINNSWIEDDENTFVVDEGGATVGDIKIGDFVPAEGGGYHEVVDLLADPEDPNGTIVVRKIVSSGELYSTRVTEKKSPGVGWSNGKVLKGTLRRRNELSGKTPAEVKALASKPVVVAPEPVTKEKTPTPKGKKSITPEETQSVVSDAIETITSGAKSDATVEEAVKGLPLDDTIKSSVLADREDASINHLSADGVALKVGDKVRGTKTGRIGEVRALLTTYGPRGYKNYVKVKFDDAAKRENISAGSLQIINPDDGGGFFVDTTPPTVGEPVNPNETPKSTEELTSLLTGDVTDNTPAVEVPEEPVVMDAEERSRVWKENEEKRMKYALELNYRQVSPEALKELTAAVQDISQYDKGHQRTVTAYMPSLSTGKPVEAKYTFVKPSKRDLEYREDFEPDDIIVKIGPSNTEAVIKSDGKILYFDNPSTPNWWFSVRSPDLYTAIEKKDEFTLPLGENPNLQKMGMISLDQEFPEETTGSPDETPDPDFIVDSPDAEPKGIKPTKQQQAVIDAVVAGKDVIVQALAGTGKTSTLKMAAKAVAEKDPDKTILYIAFNKAVAAELNADPDKPSNMVARTNTQVAWHHSPKWMQKRSFDKTAIGLPTDVADHLEIGPVKVTEIKKDGTKVEATLSSREVVAVVRQAVTAFAQSADEKIMPQHFTDNFVNIPEVFIDYANRWWDDVSSPKGRLTMNQSFPEKYVQLNGIDVTMSPSEAGANPATMIPAADIIFFDEAQDINDVAGDWVRKQTVQKVFVGDGNQSIYGFRGAKDQLDTLEGADKLQITESFRFGPNIAAPANRFLAVAGKPERVVGAGKDQGKVVESLDQMPDPDAVLVRTNGGGFKAMLEYLEEGKVVGISQSTKTRLEEVIDTTSWLMGGKKGSKPAKYNAEIGMYDSWEELSTAVREGKARPVKAFYDLVTQNGMQSIREILDRVVVEREETAESKIALKNYKPLTLDKVENGSTGKLDKDVTYTIEGDDVVLTGFFKFNNEKLKEAGFKARKDADGNWAKDRRLTIEDDLKKVDKLNQLKKILEGVIEPVKADVVITTAHQSKGLQWNKVRIYDDFWGPKFNKETGEIDMPAPEELRLAYVAVTRAQQEVYLGPLTWVNDYTSEEDEQAIAPSFTLQAMSNIETDPVPVTPEEFDNEVQETAKKIDPATQKIADAIIAALEAGTAPWRKPWTGGGFLPTSVATGKMYEGTNVLVLWAAQERNGWSDNRWLTYKQAEKLGGNIKRGEKATSIIHWTPKFKDVKQPDGTIEKVFVYTPPKIINVFNVEQAEGINLPPLVKGEPIPVSQAEQTLLDTYKDRPEIFYKSQDSAYYSPVTDTIHLPLREQFGAEQDIFETIVHELAHSTGHTSRVNRKDLTDNYGTHKASRGEEELIAEISVALVAARLGVEIDFGNVAAYAKSWLGALKDDPTMIIKAAKQAQKAVDHMLGKQEEPAKVDEEGNPIEPVGEGVGSEGKTGDQIAEDAGLKPETTPEPNLGEEGQTGEEIAKAKTPKNIDPNQTAEQIKFGSKMHTIWNDVTYDPERKSEWRIEGASGVMFQRIMEGQEVISDEAEVGKYVTDILVKYGYGDRVFNLSMANSDEFFAQNPEHSEVEAAISRGMTEQLPDSHPFKDKDLPVLLVRSRGTTKVALLHEIAHMMEANWKNPNGDDGHNAVWYATWIALLRSEGFTKQANILETVAGKLDEGDTGVINL